MAFLRSEAMAERYREYRQAHAGSALCAICSAEPIKAFKHWKAIPNSFPYDLVADQHHMIVPLRHVKEGGLTAEEREELAAIKESFISPNYDFIIEGALRHKSIPEHFHLHLIVSNDE